jgi:hypothetical protein
VCPVGDDWPALEASPVRRADLPPRLQLRREGGLVRLDSAAARAR